MKENSVDGEQEGNIKEGGLPGGRQGWAAGRMALESSPHLIAERLLI